MDIFLIIGVITGLLSIVVGMIVKGADVMVLLNPAAAIIILVGTAAAVMNSFPKKEFLNIPKIVGVLFKERKIEDAADIIEQIADISKTARKNGLLSLEQSMQGMDNKFLKNGLRMVIDGMERETISEILHSEINSMEERHRAGASIFTSAGGAAPTLGVLGAVIGLIGALGNLSDTERLAHMIAAAFVATLYGIFFGYVIFHPFASRLKRKSHEEISNMYIILEGVLAIQAGENPTSIKMKLACMVEPKERAKVEENSKGE
ncbi:flagellar motor stator protein MotA [Clostridium sp. A1-XYC3]|uniref:Flagellar motor stator protein MotA n=1 Tax=Clostridium tanneri TaxID=3037988 RepID=A0ABU4JPK7_9CLOT|nr:flagellar motor stator protein MotA [Clostridium sp. A1-XYC3]MDW8800064.1 flagellar motor stator protein MotA [Clostridium sp. A1-XYC3]